jgi:hypothetical protein
MLLVRAARLPAHCACARPTAARLAVTGTAETASNSVNAAARMVSTTPRGPAASNARGGCRVCVESSWKKADMQLTIMLEANPSSRKPVAAVRDLFLTAPLRRRAAILRTLQPTAQDDGWDRTSSFALALAYCLCLTAPSESSSRRYDGDSGNSPIGGSALRPFVAHHPDRTASSPPRRRRLTLAPCTWPDGPPPEPQPGVLLE